MQVGQEPKRPTERRGRDGDRRGGEEATRVVLVPRERERAVHVHVPGVRRRQPERTGGSGSCGTWTADECGGEIYERDDDKPESIKKRLEIYEKDTKPLIDYYKQKGLLREITINKDFGSHREEIMERLLAVIKTGKE